jgi:ATP-dependent Clp protease adaptor protein ClpS
VALEQELREPGQYRVLLHNDDYTTVEFVVAILMTVFRKNMSEAKAITLAVHEKGRGECGVYPAEVAETKVAVVHSKARAAGFPLRCSLEGV